MDDSGFEKGQPLYFKDLRGTYYGTYAGVYEPEYDIVHVDFSDGPWTVAKLGRYARMPRKKVVSTLPDEYKPPAPPLSHKSLLELLSQ